LSRRLNLYIKYSSKRPKLPKTDRYIKSWEGFKPFTIKKNGDKEMIPNRAVLTTLNMR
jgi:hypothetical protein